MAIYKGEHLMTYPEYLEALVEAWETEEGNENAALDLAQFGQYASKNPNNLHVAGVFYGMARVAAWQIYRGTNEVHDLDAIQEAIYQKYGVAW